ncbi:MAG: DNA polymerase III subunit gamma/tau [Chloroflexi bacterium]|nr:DNA polymerase III subunit gamma/tau [Chloroflexota bacterium]
MDSQALYRKWRPQTLSDLAGQEHVTRALKNALERDRVVHAYLFCGPRGTGKTSTGRILAKAVNCDSGGRGDPCNTCSMCRSITNGSALDVIEIDAASNRGIDEIRALRERANFAPTLARHKVYIIDEVHMLTDAAANALLKTLEEPPPHVMFVLATTESHKLLPTILSRCQRYDFRRLTQPAIAGRLAQICQGENLRLQPDALNQIAKAASGSLRDAVNLLEQMVNYYGPGAELAQVQSMLGIGGDRRCREVARAILARDTPAALGALNAALTGGADLRQFQRELLEYMRQLLLVHCGTGSAVDATAEDIKEMQEIVAGASLDHIVDSLKLLAKADLRQDGYASLPLEVAIVESGLTTEKSGPARPMPEPKPKLQTSARPQPSAVRQEVSGSAAPVKPAVPPEVPAKAAPLAATTGPAAPAVAEPANPKDDDWEKMLTLVKAVNKNVETYLRQCEHTLEDGTATLCFVHPYIKDKVEAPDKARLVEDSLLKATGKSYKLKCIIQPKETKPKQQSGPQGHLVQAALKMGAKIIHTEERHAE